MTINTISGLFKEELAKINETLKECSSKEMIANNEVNPNTMGFANSVPGEFAPEEITDKSNLENTGIMANDRNTDVKPDVSVTMVVTKDEGEDNHSDHCHTVDSILPEIEKEMIDISAEIPEEENDINESLKEAVTSDSIRNEFSHLFTSTSEVAKTFREALEKPTNDYAGPLDFTPDTRINVSDVLNVLKKEIGEGSEGIHVDAEVASSGKNVYKVSQVDKDLLPKKIHVLKQVLELKDGSYIPVDIESEEAK